MYLQSLSFVYIFTHTLHGLNNDDNPLELGCVSFTDKIMRVELKAVAACLPWLSCKGRMYADRIRAIFPDSHQTVFARMFCESFAISRDFKPLFVIVISISS